MDDREETEVDKGHVPLSRAPLGATCRIVGLSARGFCRRRLLDMGFVAGACVTPVRRSPGGDPTAYKVKSSIIALRRTDAAGVWVEIARQPG